MPPCCNVQCASSACQQGTWLLTFNRWSDCDNGWLNTSGTRTCWLLSTATAAIICCCRSVVLHTRVKQVLKGHYFITSNSTACNQIFDIGIYYVHQNRPGKNVPCNKSSKDKVQVQSQQVQVLSYQVQVQQEWTEVQTRVPVRTWELQVCAWLQMFVPSVLRCFWFGDKKESSV